MKALKKKPNSDIQPEYDFSKGVRGKYAKQFSKGTNLVALAPDVLKDFPDSNSVNEALRAIAKIANRKRRKITA
jgi:ribosomal 50S subunit-associated protein YjgA (DUF615 family)